MARIREMLRRADTTRHQPPNGAPAPRAFPPEEIPFRTAEEEEVPFIEVGGRDTPVEASPSVLANNPKTASRNQQEERTRSMNFGERHGTATPAAEARLTVLYISFCNQGS